MGASPSREVRSVERIIGYRFKNKRLLEEALTHSSPPSDGADSVSSKRLEFLRLKFLGNSVIRFAIISYFFIEYPELNPENLHNLRKDVHKKKLACVAFRHDLYQHVRSYNLDSLNDDKVRKFAKAVREEDDEDVSDGPISMEATNILADIVECIVGAVYCDVDYDLKRVWKILKGLLEPIIEDLEHDLCQKQGKKVVCQKKRWTESICFNFFLFVLIMWFLNLFFNNP